MHRRILFYTRRIFIADAPKSKYLFDNKKTQFLARSIDNERNNLYVVFLKKNPNFSTKKKQKTKTLPNKLFLDAKDYSNYIRQTRLNSFQNWKFKGFFAQLIESWFSWQE